MRVRQPRPARRRAQVALKQVGRRRLAGLLGGGGLGARERDRVGRDRGGRAAPASPPPGGLAATRPRVEAGAARQQQRAALRQSAETSQAEMPQEARRQGCRPGAAPGGERPARGLLLHPPRLPALASAAAAAAAAAQRQPCAGPHGCLRGPGGTARAQPAAESEGSAASGAAPLPPPAPRGQRRAGVPASGRGLGQLIAPKPPEARVLRPPSAPVAAGTFPLRLTPPFAKPGHAALQRAVSSSSTTLTQGPRL